MKNISFRLSLDGGAEITRALSDLKDAGKAAVDALGDGLDAGKAAATALRDAVGDAGQALGDVGKDAADAIKATAEATAKAEREIQAAGRAIGFVSDEVLEKQVAAHRAALDTLVGSGKLSAEEIARATEATEAKIAVLHKRMGKEGVDSAKVVEDAYKSLGVSMAADVKGEADKIRAAYDAIAKSGTASAADLKAAKAAMVGQLRALEDRTGQSVTRFGHLRLAVQDLRGAVLSIGTAIGGAAAAVGLMVKGTADLADEHIKAGRALGLTVEDYGRLTHAIEQSGLSQEQARQSLGRIAQLATASVESETKATEALTEAKAKAAAAQTKMQGAYAKVNALAAQSHRVAGGARDAILKQHAAALKEAEKARAEWNRTQEDVAKAGAGNEDILKKLGIAARDSGGKMRGTKDILLDLADQFQAMPDGIEKTALASRLFGEEAGPRMVNLLNGGRASIEALGDEAEKLGIVFDKDAAQAAEAFNDSLDSLGKAFLGIKNEISMDLIPALTGMIRGFLEFFQGMRENYPTLTKVIVVLAGMATVIVPLLAGVGLLTQGLIGIGPAITGVSAAVGFLTAGIRALSLAVFANPIGLLVLAVAAAAVAIYVYWDEIAAAAVAAWDWIIEAAKAAWEVLQNITPVGLLIKHWDDIKAAGAAAWQGITDAAATARDLLIEGLAYLILGVSDVLAEVQALFQTAWDFVTSTASAAWEAITAPGVEFMAWLEGLGQRVQDALTAPFTAAAEVIATVWAGLMAPIQAVIDLAKRALAAVKSALGGGGKSSNDNLPRKAGGGPIVGPGTGTSDSVLMWGSNGEFMVRAAAVRKYGLSLLHAINSGQFRLPAFAAGGLIDVAGGLADRLAPAPRPGLEAAGAVAGPGLSGTPVVLNIDGQTYAMAATPREAERLAKTRVGGLGRAPRHAHLGQG